MTHKYGRLMCCNVRFTHNSVMGYMKWPYHSDYSRTLYHASYVTGTDATDRSTDGIIPAIGGVIQDEDAGGTATDIILYDTIKELGVFVAPLDCRLISVAYSMYHQEPVTDSEGVRWGVMIGNFTTGDNRNYVCKTSTGTDWKCIARVDMPENVYVGDEDGQPIKGGAEFNTSTQDLSAGQVVGLVTESIGASSGFIYGVVTLVFRTV